jgi:hypothetical protein
MAGNSLLDRFRIFRRPIIVGACAITARRRSRAAIPIAGTAGARSDGSAAAAVLALAALMKDGTKQTRRYRRRDAQQKRAFDGRAVGRKADVIEQLPEAIAWAEAQGPGRHSVARRLRAAGRRLVSAPRQCLIEAEFDARVLQRSALYLGTLIRRHRGFFGPCAAQPRRCGRRNGVFRADDRRIAWPFGAGRDCALRTYPRSRASRRRGSGVGANRGCT